jgi:hypothetical protein
MKVIPLDRRRDVAMLQRLAFALGARSTGPAFEQLVDMVYEARRGSDETREKLAAYCEALKAENEAFKAELAAERAKRAQLQVLAEWPSDRARRQ